ncbi:MAG: hypothetical protein ACOYEG_02190 [Petrimonas sp.]|jgi:hypothetical protein
MQIFANGEDAAYGIISLQHFRLKGDTYTATSTANSSGIGCLCFTAGE